MSRRLWLVFLLCLHGCGTPEPKPNILLITLDAARADHFSAYGYSRPTSPGFDKLARSGVLFQNAYSQSDWTLASLSSLLSGVEPGRHGAVTPLWALNPKVTTLPKLLVEQGYETAMFAQSYFHEVRYGLNRGFKTYKTFPAEKADAGELTNQAIRWLARNTDRPFFLWVHYFDPHAPYLPREPWYSRFHPGRYSGKFDFSSSMDPNQVVPPGAELPPDAREQMLALYDSEIAHTDAALQTLLDAVPLTRTVVCVTADHGEEFKEHGQIGHGINLQRELIHVPLVLAGPGVEPAGTRVAATVQHVDVVPTLLELARLPAPNGLAGRSLVRLFSGQDASHPDLAFAEQMESSEFISTYSMVKRPWHLILQYGRDDLKLRGWQLFDFVKDPVEQNNLWDPARPEHAALRNQLEAYVKRVGGPAPPQPVVTPVDPQRMDQLRSLGYLQGE